MPSVQGNDDDASSDCSDLSTASSFEEDGEEGASEIDAEFEVVNGSVTLCSVIGCQKFAFSNTVVNNWNSLSEQCFNRSTVNTFKTHVSAALKLEMH